MNFSNFLPWTCQYISMHRFLLLCTQIWWFSFPCFHVWCNKIVYGKISIDMSQAEAVSEAYCLTIILVSSGFCSFSFGWLCIRMIIHMLFNILFYYSFLLDHFFLYVFSSPDWKAQLKAPPRDSRYKTEVKYDFQLFVLLVKCCLHVTIIYVFMGIDAFSSSIFDRIVSLQWRIFYLSIQWKSYNFTLWGSVLIISLT